MSRKIKLSEDIYKKIERFANAKGVSVAQAIANRFNIKVQFDKSTKEGVLQRVYHYQKSRYGDTSTLKKFMKKWNKDSRFKQIWSDYENSDFNTNYKPTFFRFGTDAEEEKLYVTTKGRVRIEKESLEMMGESR